MPRLTSPKIARSSTRAASARADQVDAVADPLAASTNANARAGILAQMDELSAKLRPLQEHFAAIQAETLRIQDDVNAGRIAFDDCKDELMRIVQDSQRTLAEIQPIAAEMETLRARYERIEQRMDEHLDAMLDQMRARIAETNDASATSSSDDETEAPKGYYLPEAELEQTLDQHAPTGLNRKIAGPITRAMFLRRTGTGQRIARSAAWGGTIGAGSMALLVGGVPALAGAIAASPFALVAKAAGKPELAKKIVKGGRQLVGIVPGTVGAAAGATVGSIVGGLTGGVRQLYKAARGRRSSD